MIKKGKYLLKYCFAKEKPRFPTNKVFLSSGQICGEGLASVQFLLFAVSCLDAVSTALATCMRHSEASRPQQS